MSREIAKRTVSGVSFECTRTGSLDESEIPNDDFESHYLYPGETKTASSYPVVGGDGCLYRGNVDSAWGLGARGQADEETHDDRLKELGQEFDNNPIPQDAYESMTTKMEKHVPIAKADGDRQVAVGVAMVPDAVDLAGDFERAETIERFAEGYMERLAQGESKNGVMHSVFPDVETVSHVENRILQSQETIGDSTYPAGTWIVGKKVHDDALWDLITNDEGTLSGFSIGGYVTRERDYDAPPADVRESETVKANRNEAGVTEIQDGIIEEISLVDSPAVPEAKVQVAKGADGIAKAAPELTDSVESASEYLVSERGHNEQAATELAEFLNDHKHTAKASHENEHDSDSWMARAKAFFTGSDSDVEQRAEGRTEKVGATLSSKNRNSMMQIHDASLSVLHDAGYASRRNTFSDDPRVDFELMDSDASQSDELAESSTDADHSDTTMSQDKADELTERIERIESMLEEATEEEEEVEKSDDNGETEEIEQLTEVVERLAANQEKMLSAQGVSQQSQNSATNTQKSAYAGSAFDPRGGA